MVSGGYVAMVAPGACSCEWVFLLVHIAACMHYVHVLILSNMEYNIDFLNIRGM